MEEQKKCSQCGLMLSLPFFHKKGSGTRDRCKACSKLYHQEHYRLNKQKYIEAALATRKAIRQFVDEAKKGPCVDCKRSFPPYVMDFDHIADDKVMNISQLVLWGSLRRVKDEIAKCELVCSNCHRIRTHNRYAGVVEQQDAGLPSPEARVQFPPPAHIQRAAAKSLFTASPEEFGKAALAAESKKK